MTEQVNLTVDEVCRRLQISRSTLYRQLGGGLFVEPLRVGSIIRFRLADIENWEVEQTTAAVWSEYATCLADPPANGKLEMLQVKLGISNDQAELHRDVLVEATRLDEIAANADELWTEAKKVFRLGEVVSARGQLNQARLTAQRDAFIAYQTAMDAGRQSGGLKANYPRLFKLRPQDVVRNFSPPPEIANRQKAIDKAQSAAQERKVPPRWPRPT